MAPLTPAKHRGFLAAVVAAVAIAGWLALTAPASATPTSIIEFSAGLDSGSSPENLVPGPDGNMWFLNGTFPQNRIGRITADGAISEFHEGLGKESSLEDIVAGPDGNLWFTDRASSITPRAIGRITPGGTITEFSSGLGESRPRRIVAGPDGDLWFTATGGAPAVGRITTAGAISKFSLPSLPRVPVLGADGNVWFTYGNEGSTGRIARITREGETTTITFFASGLNAGSEPREITLGADGNLWFIDSNEGNPAIGRVTPAGTITEFSAGLSQNSWLKSLVVGVDGNVWFTDSGAGAVGRITSDGAITEFTGGVLQPESGPWDITAGLDGNLWFTYGGQGALPAIGKISTSGAITLLTAGVSSVGEPTDIATGPGGLLWFTATGYYDAIGRVIPGDDSPVKEATEVNQPPVAPPIVVTGQLSLVGRTISVAMNGTAAVTLRCDGTVFCAGKLTLTAKVLDSGRSVMRVIGHASFNVLANHVRVVKARLTRPGRALLRAHNGRLAASLTITKRSPAPQTIERSPVRLVRSSH